jgi:sugar (pentulose or hexulose) kinase
MSELVLGIDVGTSGVRVAAIDHAAQLVAFASSAMLAARHDGQRVNQDPSVWERGLAEAMARLASMIDLARVGALSVDATSGTLVGIDDHGLPVATGSLYNDRADGADISAVERAAPPRAAVHGATSPLARAMRLLRVPGTARVLHQADWIAAQFTGRFDISDESNALKTGYDPVARRWPVWISATDVALSKLPAVVAAGSVIGQVSAEASRRFGLSIRTFVVAGMTDGCAAFMAAGAAKPGNAVTSLGSTLILKLASEVPLFAPEFGIYSHRIGDLWLAGGASNSGGAVLAQFFSAEQLREISSRIDVSVSSGLDYYPLPASGERFPINDPALAPRLTPRPDDDAVFLQGLFEGIARVEALGYRRLFELGGSGLTKVTTVGGGAANEVWRRIRAATLGVPVMASENGEAAVGVARLALSAVGGGSSA